MASSASEYAPASRNQNDSEEAEVVEAEVQCENSQETTSPLESLRAAAMAAAMAAAPARSSASPRPRSSVVVDWGAILRHLQDHPQDAALVDKAECHTPLHWAVLAHSSDDTSAPSSNVGGSGEASFRLRVVQRLLALRPEAAEVRCRARGYTPLAAAVALPLRDDGAALDAAAKLVGTLLLAEPRALHVRCHRGRDPLALHVRAASVASMSFRSSQSLLLAEPTTSGSLLLGSQSASARSLLLEQRLLEADSGCGGPARGFASPPTAVLEVMARRATRAQLEGALEELVRCNSTALADLIAREEARSASDRRWWSWDDGSPGGSSPSRPSPLLRDSQAPWPWPWICVLLRELAAASLPSPQQSFLNHRRARTFEGVDGDDSRFSPLHAACRIVDCPPAIFFLTLRFHPADARTPLDGSDGGSAPLLPHRAVEAWQSTAAHEQSSFSAVPPSRCRRSLCLAMLDAEYPEGRASSPVKQEKEGQGTASYSATLEGGRIAATTTTAATAAAS